MSSSVTFAPVLFHLLLWLRSMTIYFYLGRPGGKPRGSGMRRSFVHEVCGENLQAVPQMPQQLRIMMGDHMMLNDELSESVQA